MYMSTLCLVAVISSSLLPVALTSEEYALNLGALGIGEGSVLGMPQTYRDDGGHNFDAAIHSKRTLSVVPVHETYEEPKVNSVSVDAAEMPLVLTLKSKSSPLIVNAVHQGAEKGSIKKTQSVDAPHIRVHETLKPVLQEVREIVQPKRQITQMVSPVMQKINTFVSAHKGGGGGGYGGHGGYIGPGHYGAGEMEGGAGYAGDHGYNGGLNFGGHVMDYGSGGLGNAGAGGDYEGYGKGEVLGGYSRSIHRMANLHKRRSKLY